MSLIDKSSSSSIDEDDTKQDDGDENGNEGYQSTNVNYGPSQAIPASQQKSNTGSCSNYAVETRKVYVNKGTLNRKRDTLLLKQYEIEEPSDMDEKRQLRVRFSDTVQEQDIKKCCTERDLADDCQKTTMEGTPPNAEQSAMLQNEILILNCQVEILRLEKMQALQCLKETNEQLASCQKENEDSRTEAVKMANSLKKKIRELTSVIQEFKTVHENTNQIANLEHVQCAVKQRNRQVKTLENHLVMTQLDSDVKEGYLSEILNQINIMEEEFDIQLCEKEAEVQKLREQFLQRQSECEQAVTQQLGYIEDLENQLGKSQEEALGYRKDNVCLRMSLGVVQSELSSLYTEIAELKQKLDATCYERNDLENRCIELYETVSNLEARIITEKKHDFSLERLGIKNEVHRNEKSDCRDSEGT